MTSFGYRSNPRYAIKECSSCGTLYTRDCGCSKGNVEDKILVPKPPKNCARCTRCSYLVDGPNCQGCALLRQEIEENLVTQFLDFQNTSEPSNASTNIVNDPREPYIVKQDHGSFDFFESNEEFSSIDDDSLSIDDIDYVEASPPDSELVSSEETNTFDNSLPAFETFCFDVEEISSGSTTTPPNISFPKYEVFYDDHVKEISSGSPTTHSDSSLYASFIFDLSINPFPPADRSDSYDFTDELIPFISPPEYDCFLFKVEPNSRGFTKDVVEDISPTKEPQVLNTLPTHPFLQLNMKFQPSNEYLFTYVVWIILPFLVYSVVPHYLLSLRNEDAIFDPGICNLTFSRPDISHRCGTVKKFNTHRSHLNECPMLINGQNNPTLDVLLFDFYPP
nr:hypothetical protein [Tanacetum cinerariifolium]